MATLVQRTSIKKITVRYVSRCEPYKYAAMSGLRDAFNIDVVDGGPLRLVGSHRRKPAVARNGGDIESPLYSVEKMLAYLQRQSAGGHTIWLMDREMSLDYWSGCFGAAGYGTDCIVSVSMVGGSPDRVAKTAVHEVGHVLGLGHCDDNERCIMKFSSLPGDVDDQSRHLCEGCAKILGARCKDKLRA